MCKRKRGRDEGKAERLFPLVPLGNGKSGTLKAPRHGSFPRPRPAATRRSGRGGRGGARKRWEESPQGGSGQSGLCSDDQQQESLQPQPLLQPQLHPQPQLQPLPHPQPQLQPLLHPQPQFQLLPPQLFPPPHPQQQNRMMIRTIHRQPLSFPLLKHIVSHLSLVPGPPSAVPGPWI